MLVNTSEVKKVGLMLGGPLAVPQKAYKGTSMPQEQKWHCDMAEDKSAQLCRPGSTG